MSELSPAAQAVVDAASEVYWDWGDMVPSASHTIAAAALRAAADQVVPVPIQADTPERHWALLGVKHRLLAYCITSRRYLS